MPRSLTREFKIRKSRFRSTGALDVVLDVDTKVFIDPFLVKESKAPELKGAYDALRKRFEDVIRLLVAVTAKGDVAWRAAERLLVFPEVRGLCIGYSRRGTSGSGMGKGISEQLIETAKEIVDKGIKDPELFELMGLFEDGIGADRISDMAAGLMSVHIARYSQRVFSELGVPGESWTINGESFVLPRNRFTGEHVLLIPMDVLRPLPMAYDWTDVDYIVNENDALRGRLNALVGETWKAATKLTKPDLKAALMSEPELLRSLIDAYKAKEARLYDFDKDSASAIIWCAEAEQACDQFPLPLPTISASSTIADLVIVVDLIVAKFKQLIEVNGLDRLLYREDGRPRHEEHAQRLFYGIADVYCAASNLDISREANAGRGPVDFKFSAGYHKRVVVETKLTTNGKLIAGYTKQLPEYKTAERAAYGVYLVVDVDHGSQKRLKDLTALTRVPGTEGPKLVVVDGRRRPSASKL